MCVTRSKLQLARHVRSAWVRVVVWFIRFMGSIGIGHQLVAVQKPRDHWDVTFTCDDTTLTLISTHDCIPIAPKAGCKRPRPGQNCWAKPWTLHLGYTLTTYPNVFITP